VYVGLTYTLDDFNNCSQYQGNASPMISRSAQPVADVSETRCECGQLIAKVRGQALELKCKRCKRIVIIPFNAIEGWSAASSGKIHEKA
jgi:phage FluMu protein Com